MIGFALALAMVVQSGSVPGIDDYADRPFANGEWRVVEQGSVISARFSNLVDLACYRSNGVLRLAVSDPAQPLAPLPPQLLVVTTYGARWLQHPAPIHPRDVIGDQMSFSRGRIVLVPQGAAPLVVPAGAEVARIVEACRG